MSKARWRIVTGAVALCALIITVALFLSDQGPDSQDQVRALPAADRALEDNRDGNRAADGLSPEDPDSVELGTVDRDRGSVNPAAHRRFVVDYNLPHADEREVFDRHLDTLGPQAMLDYLEEIYPRCHSQAHDLGAAIYAQAQDVNQALRTCRRQCTAGCMHGVVLEAFKDHTIDDVKGQLEQYCEGGRMSEAYKPGNCAHGLGHALMWVSGRNLGDALDACATFTIDGMSYYCATGVYMEYWSAPDPGVDPETVSLHYPCDTYTLYRAACYKFRAPKMLRALGRSWKKFTSECLSLSGARRLGCFHGLGFAMTNRVAKHPERLARYCRLGTSDDQAMCIEGVIEKLADYDEARALEACASVSGANAEVCEAAAREKMYRLNKPSLPLYTMR